MNILKTIRFIAICFFVINLLGCGSSIKVRSTITPASTLAGFQYSSIKKVVVLPFDNFSKLIDVEKTITSLFTTELVERKLFEVEDITDYLRRIMQHIKIAELPAAKDIAINLGKTYKCEAIIAGTIDAYEIGKKGDSKYIEISFTMYDTMTGNALLTVNASCSGTNHIEMRGKMIVNVIDSLESYINKEREKEAAVRK